MNETPFKVESDGEKVQGIWHSPSRSASARAAGGAVVFLHGWSGYRTGPHDLLVKAARRLAAEGWHCIRFDFRGWGYSEGDRSRASARTLLGDLESVLDHVRERLGPEARIVLAGICSGAKLALLYAGKGRHPVYRIIELSSPPLRPEEARNSVAARSVRSTAATYLGKALRRETWLRLFRGRLDLQAVWRNLTAPWKRLRPVRRPNRKRGDPGATERPLEHLVGDLLLIHGEKDPETGPAVGQIEALARRQGVPYRTCIIRGANHSFYGLSWEEEILDLMSHRLKEPPTLRECKKP